MKIAKTRLAAALVAMTVLVGSQAAFATTTLSVDGLTSPAGPVPLNATATNSITFETDYAVTTTCSQANIDGYVERGASGTVGTKIGAIAEFQLGDCVTSDLLMNSVGYMDPSSSEWTIHLLEVPTAAQRFVNVEIRNVSALMRTPSAAPWSLAMHLTGSIQAILDTSLDRLIIDTRSLSAPHDLPLLIDALDKWGTKGSANLTTFGGEFQDGDLTSIRVTFQLNRNISVS